ncbi:MAG: V-type ATP synthase subunit I [Candidatus Woesearchaeota archaeon]|jgi:V/A-type H+-transporting ATPase subunit I|nr:V-type ATP synthase subunit I [Candidatus Woesearchaeota archaeon]|tara:strand:+ start:1327 stop:3186 length:1860 start_codon:yes stop_codon:yes gene_type:complete
MLRPYDMDSVIITGPKDLQESIIKDLHKLKILHIVEHSKNELADIGEPLESANKLSGILVKVRSLITSLNIKKGEYKLRLKRGLLEINQTTKKLNEDVNSLLEKLRKIEEQMSKNKALIQELAILENLGVPLQSFADYKSLAYFIGYVKDEYDLNYLKDKLSGMTKKFMLLDNKLKKQITIVLFVDVKNKEDALDMLQKIDFIPASISNVIGLKGDVKSSLERLERQNEKLDSLKGRINKHIENLAYEHKEFLLAADEFLTQELERAEAPLRFATTKDAFLIKGWIPTRDMDHTINKLNKASKDRIFIHNDSAKTNDKVPVKLDNPKYAKPFEFFINLYSTPAYKEFDPTFIMLLTFPIFFGFMLGDIGYGIVAFALFRYLRNKFPVGKDLFNILLVASVSSAFFGLLYGEIFGLEQIGHFELPHILSRTHEIYALLYIAAGIGIFHVNLGLILGFINDLKEHGLAKAIFEKGSWLVLQIGVALLTLSYFDIITLPLFAGITFLLLSIAMLLKGEGIRGIIELPSIFTNIMSYARLMAIGLSSVSLAGVINDMATGFFDKGGFAVLSGILILIVGHTINIVLGLFGSFLHSLRLHYVEFFGKFFHGGAEKYKPFGLKEQ